MVEVNEPPTNVRYAAKENPNPAENARSGPGAYSAKDRHSTWNLYWGADRGLQEEPVAPAAAFAVQIQECGAAECPRGNVRAPHVPQVPPEYGRTAKVDGVETLLGAGRAAGS